MASRAAPTGISSVAPPSAGARSATDRAIAHDVRNALNGILLNLEALRAVLATSGPSPDGAARYIEALAGIVGRWLAGGDPGDAPDSDARRNSSTPASVKEVRYIAELSNTIPMTHPRILIADDEPAIAAGLSAVLADLTYEVEIVPDGQQALERLSAERFGLVLADLKEWLALGGWGAG